MKKLNGCYVIGVDHGYGNIKTANFCFPTGLIESDTEPIFSQNVLMWNGRYYSIGEGHKEFTADKFKDPDFYVLTLAAIARELNKAGIYEASVFIAAGLPLTWVSQQKEEFKRYLLQNSELSFKFRGRDFHIKFLGAEIYPQGFAAVAAELPNFTGENMLCDIGNGTMNILHIVNMHPDPLRMYTEKYGTEQCTLAIKESMMKLHHTNIDEQLITQILKTGKADIDSEYLKTIIHTAKEYTSGIYRRLREHDYDPRLMMLYVVGGGGCLIKNFSGNKLSRVIINSDICATAKGYELLAERSIKKGGIK